MKVKTDLALKQTDHYHKTSLKNPDFSTKDGVAESLNIFQPSHFQETPIEWMLNNMIKISKKTILLSKWISAINLIALMRWESLSSNLMFSFYIDHEHWTHLQKNRHHSNSGVYYYKHWQKLLNNLFKFGLDQQTQVDRSGFFCK